jgi:hypothetical protein
VAAGEEVRRPEHRERDRVGARLERRLDQAHRGVRGALVGGADVRDHEARLAFPEPPAAEREGRRRHAALTLPRAARGAEQPGGRRSRPGARPQRLRGRKP